MGLHSGQVAEGLLSLKCFAEMPRPDRLLSCLTLRQSHAHGVVTGDSAAWGMQEVASVHCDRRSDGFCSRDTTSPSTGICFPAGHRQLKTVPAFPGSWVTCAASGGWVEPRGSWAAPPPALSSFPRDRKGCVEGILDHLDKVSSLEKDKIVTSSGLIPYLERCSHPPLTVG